MAWSNIGNLKGPQGPQGPQGNAGTNGARGSKWFFMSGTPTANASALTSQGAANGDAYVDTSTWDIYYLTLP